MPTVRLSPDAILAATNLNGVVESIRDDPDAPDAAWLTRATANQSTDVRVSLPTISGSLSAGQEFRVRVRKTAESTAPTCAVELWVNGAAVSTVVAATTVSSTAGVVLAGTWDGTDIDPANIECRVVGTTGGGKTTSRATVEVGAIEWNATYASGLTWHLWDGSTEVPLTLAGVWDGATIRPAASATRL